MSADSISASFAHLHALKDLITKSLDSLESTCKEINVPWPSLDEPFYMSQTGPPLEDFARMQNAAIGRASATLVAAAAQLLNAVREPGMTVIQSSLGFLLSSAIRVATELHVVDILRDTDSKGLDIDEIAKKVQVDPAKLARILRLLATHHIFTEVRPNVFANNRNSAVLEKGQTVESLLGNAAGKYDRPESSLAALVCHLTDETNKSSANLFEALANPETAFSASPSKCAALMSKELIPVPEAAIPSKTKENSDAKEELDLDGPTIWDVLARPDPPATRFGFEKERLRRFGVAMEGGGKVLPVGEILEGFDFASLPLSSVIIDVGGGVGTMAHVLTQKYDNLKVVVQDREEVCAEGLLRWKESDPKALESGRVSFQAQNFFSPQSIDALKLKPAAFLVKHVLHDWSDPYCHAILKRLRDAAGQIGETRLLVIDYVLPYACRVSGVNDDKDEDSMARRSIPGVYQDLARPPLLGNWGATAAFLYYIDINMLCAMNAQERTLAHTRALYRSAGWEVVKVTQSKIIGQPLCLVEAKIV